MANPLILILLCHIFIDTSFAFNPPKEAPISHHEWVCCNGFIKSRGKSLFTSGETIIQNNKQLPLPLLLDTTSGLIYIDLKSKKSALIGVGKHKIVTKSILYGTKPKIVARCEADATVHNEALALSRLKGIRGVVQLYSIIPQSFGKVDIMLEYFNQGSMKSLMQAKKRIAEDDLLPIMYDLLLGLRGIHRTGFIHCDLHLGNIILNQDKHSLRAAITDLGSVCEAAQHPHNPISVQGSSSPPEALIKNWGEINPLHAENYLLGIILYVMICGDRPIWTKVFDHRILTDYSPSKKHEIYQKIRELYSKTISKFEMKKSIRRSAAKLTLKLLHPFPSERITLDEAIEELERIAKKWGQKL